MDRRSQITDVDILTGQQIAPTGLASDPRLNGGIRDGTHVDKVKLAFQKRRKAPIHKIQDQTPRGRWTLITDTDGRARLDD